MSRTFRGGKADGFEYWSNRPGNRDGQFPSRRGGKYAKKRTHRLERLEGKRQSQEAFE